jgi:hypothetical protein
VAERDEGLGRSRRIEPPPMTETVFLEGLRSVLAQLGGTGKTIADKAA